MSIKINGKTIAGLCIPNSASETEEGVIRIATDEEAKAGELTNVAVTPKQLAENGGTEVDTSNLVTLDGKQTITGAKTFGSDIQLGSNSLSFSDGALTLNPQGSSNLNITTMGGALDVTGNLTLTGNIKAYQNQAKPIELRSDGSTMSMVYGDNTLNMSDDSLTYTNASGETKDLLAGGGSSDSAVTLDTNQTITGQKTFTQQIQCSPVNSYKDMWLGQSGPGEYGLVFQSNNSPYEFNIYNQGYTASSLKVAGFEGGVKFANTVNFNSSIYDKDGNEIVGGNGGSSTVDTSNLVDLTTDQTITANKTISYGNQLKLESGTTSYNGAVYGGTNTVGNLILECQNDTGALPESIILGAQGTGSNYSRRGVFLSVPTDEAIYLGEVNSACKIEAVNDLKLWGGYKQDSYLTLSNDSMTYTKADGSVIDLLSQNTQNDNNTISVVEVYGNSSSGYRLWSDGYCEQWGRGSTPDVSYIATVTLHKPYKDKNYIILGQADSSSLSLNTEYLPSIAGGRGYIMAENTSTSSFTVAFGDNGGYGTSPIVTPFKWITKGYVS